MDTGIYIFFLLIMLRSIQKKVKYTSYTTFSIFKIWALDDPRGLNRNSSKIGAVQIVLNLYYAYVNYVVHACTIMSK